MVNAHIAQNSEHLLVCSYLVRTVVCILDNFTSVLAVRKEYSLEAYFIAMLANNEYCPDVIFSLRKPYASRF